ncbi:hypothetical protein LTR12_014367 [Friedmanniomyces endolithicus]|nr:hypothetical protein LTR74_006500 [Friedmanniomyces endolithicus]KAK1811259.1 hypothetical protein LTR12_014367 [Friedmanniomyces endolithicus]
MEDPMQAFKQGLTNLYENEKFADFTIICGPHTFRVHKAVICAHSEYFTIACSGGSFREGEKGELILKAAQPDDDGDETCDDPEAVKHMVHFFYHLDYDATSSQGVKAKLADSSGQVLSEPSRQLAIASASSESSGRKPKTTKRSKRAAAEVAGNMVMHAKVFAAAVKYQVPALQAMAASKFIAAVEVSWDNDIFAEAAHIVYTTTPEEVRALREEVAKTITEHGALLKKAAIEAVVRDIDGLAYELLMRRTPGAMTSQEYLTEYGESLCGLRCQYCGRL